MIESAWLLAGLVKAAELLGLRFALVVGWTDPEGSRPFLGALLLAYYDTRGRLVYAGRVDHHRSNADR
jgi:bifunctional non-homologous end joining protein LigD